MAPLLSSPPSLTPHQFCIIDRLQLSSLHLPAKSSVSVDDAQWIKGRVHDLFGGHEILHDRNTQVGNEKAEGNVEHPTHIHTYKQQYQTFEK
jgi:hypothetical protein